jgi:hypothetical protein
MKINVFGANHQVQPSRQEQGLHLAISNNEKKREALEIRRSHLLQELGRVREEIILVREELDRGKCTHNPRCIILFSRWNRLCLM